MKEKSLGADAAAVDLAGSIDRDAATARHTSPWGEWKCVPWDYSPGDADVNFPDGTGLALCIPGDYDAHPIPTPTAHLIAAAPDLLEALKAARVTVVAMAKASHLLDGLPQEITGRPNPRHATITPEDLLARMVEAAIAKAEGRS